MKTIELVVLAAFALFWFVFFLLICYYASKNRPGGESGRRDNWHAADSHQKSSSHSQYVGALGWFQNYRTRQAESKPELDLL